jgi:hypothetical protein
MKLNWRRCLKTLLHLGISLSLTLVLLEIGSLILVETNRVPARVPMYLDQKNHTRLGPRFGVWVNGEEHPVERPAVTHEWQPFYRGRGQSDRLSPAALGAGYLAPPTRSSVCGSSATWPYGPRPALR